MLVYLIITYIHYITLYYIVDTFMNQLKLLNLLTANLLI